MLTVIDMDFGDSPFLALCTSHSYLSQEQDGRFDPLAVHRSSRLALCVAGGVGDGEGKTSGAVEGGLRKVRYTSGSVRHRHAKVLTEHRLGQEPPPEPTDDVFDGRSLAEVRDIRPEDIP